MTMQVYRPNEYDEPHSVFLAGPSPRDSGITDWREEAIDLLRQFNFKGKVYSPVPLNMDDWNEDTYNHQIDWELFHLRKASIIAFWVPRDLETLPGFTTNVEFGMFVNDPRPVLLGYPKGTPKMKYIDYLARKHYRPVTHYLEYLMEEVADIAANRDLL